MMDDTKPATQAVRLEQRSFVADGVKFSLWRFQPHWIFICAHSADKLERPDDMRGPLSFPVFPIAGNIGRYAKLLGYIGKGQDCIGSMCCDRHSVSAPIKPMSQNADRLAGP